MENPVKIVYAVPNYECNLACPHCELKDRHVEFDHDKFFAQLKTFNNRQENLVILFGGEPTLHKDRLYECLAADVISTVSTNLVDVDDVFIQMMLENPISLATSWNSTRFSKDQYQKWLKTLSKFTQKPCQVSITMTDDLIADSNYQHVLNVLTDIQNSHGCEKILFEHCVGEYATEDFNRRCDQWLCRIHSDWKFSMQNKIEDKLRHDGWRHDCKDIYTLEPDGNLRNGCPQSLNYKLKPIMKCLTCEKADRCQPCRLQCACSYPANLANVLANDDIAIQ